ncbi:uncharacterized protein BDR25DRAFT_350855 [Lindgomyces ingoldianus]|uniref:Uncharacterized protein n=1 Tax=Lindgomyces ingoldianus TaxID=673940 RepID=A0ACB6R8B2_9PLEO|nr:uncharacterized protein BDR25DRAFT_350855 [Lindgomyces ingoldianus]KAF2475499.1 hypothetical protein BDR25DRAFT_350855 [Lindgomyces ingoldianus]
MASSTMPSSSLLRVTVLSYLIFITAIIILALSLAEIVMEAKVLTAFSSGLQVQLPGTSLAEWLFIPLRPMNLDTGPTEAIFVAGAFGVVCGLFEVAWLLAIWFGVKGVVVSIIRILGRIACIITFAATAGDLALLAYVLVVESKNKLPDLFLQWRDYDFTREYWVCKALPSRIVNAEDLYGFPVCQHALMGTLESCEICAYSAFDTFNRAVRVECCAGLEKWSFGFSERIEE